MRQTVIILLPLFALAGCGGPLDKVTEVKDLRVLAIKAEQPEVLVPNVASPSPVDMRFSALIVDPRGGPIDYAWSFCPVESSSACMDFDAKRAAAPTELQEPLGDMRSIGLSGTALPANEVAPTLPDTWWSQRGIWPYAVPDFAFTADKALADYHVKTSFMGLGMGAWPSAILDVSKDGATSGPDAIEAEKRVVIGIAERRASFQLVELAGQNLGFELCPAGQTPQDVPGCLDIQDPTPNQNPVFAAVRVSPGEHRKDANWTDVAIGDPGDVAGVVEVQAAQSLRILPVFTDASYETYQTIKADLVNGTLFVEDKTEELSVSWFATAGNLADKLTWPKFSIALDTAWTAPDAPPADTDGRVTIYMVARDQRGGEEWMSLEIRVLP